MTSKDREIELLLNELKLEFGPSEGPGKFIAVEGRDGSGKTTFVKVLCRYFQTMGIEAYTTKLPTASMRRSRHFKLFSQKGRDDLVDPLGLQVRHMADRIQHSEKFIKPLVQSGAIVISDRYITASVGSLFTRNMPLDGWFRNLCQYLIKPDLFIYMYASAEVAIARIQRRPQEKDIKIDKQAFTESLELGKLVALANNMLVIDTSNTTGPYDCVDVIHSELSDLLKQIPRKNIR